MAKKILIKKTTLTSTSFQERLKGRGAKRLAGGAYASVFKKPKAKTVIKVARGDRAYTAYVKAILNHQDNPFFPKITKATEYRTGRERYLVVELEKLKPGRGYLWDICSTIRSACQEPFEAGVQQLTTRFNTKEKHHLEVMHKVLNKLWDKYCIDMHNGNIMFRGKQVVVTDPAAGGSW
jgi:hypothetical protein